MSPRRPTPPPPKPADFPPAKTHAALKKQLAALEKFRGKNYYEVESDEQEWTNLTLNILNHGFGENSENVGQFHSARWAGEHYMGGMSPGLIQQNFGKRIEAFAAMLKSSLAELELVMPEPEIAGAYEPGDEYQFYRDLKTIVGFAARDLFIIDNYLDTQLFDVYVENINPAVNIRALTNQVSNSLQVVAEKFAKRGNFELRSSKDAHVEHSGATLMRGMYEAIWNSAGVVVKG